MISSQVFKPAERAPAAKSPAVKQVDTSILVPPALAMGPAAQAPEPYLAYKEELLATALIIPA